MALTKYNTWFVIYILYNNPDNIEKIMTDTFADLFEQSMEGINLEPGAVVTLL